MKLSDKLNLINIRRQMLRFCGHTNQYQINIKSKSNQSQINIKSKSEKSQINLK